MKGLIYQAVNHFGIIRQPAGQPHVAWAEDAEAPLFPQNARGNPGFLPETIRFQLGVLHHSAFTRL